MNFRSLYFKEYFLESSNHWSDSCTKAWISNQKLTFRRTKVEWKKWFESGKKKFAQHNLTFIQILWLLLRAIVRRVKPHLDEWIAVLTVVWILFNLWYIHNLNGFIGKPKKEGGDGLKRKKETERVAAMSMSRSSTTKIRAKSIGRYDTTHKNMATEDHWKRNSSSCECCRHSLRLEWVFRSLILLFDGCVASTTNNSHAKMYSLKIHICAHNMKDLFLCPWDVYAGSRKLKSLLHNN